MPDGCRWEDSLVKTAKKLRMGAGYNEGTDVGPMISPEAKQRAERIIGSAEEQVRACSASLDSYVVNGLRLVHRQLFALQCVLLWSVPCPHS